MPLSSVQVPITAGRVILAPLAADRKLPLPDGLMGSPRHDMRGSPLPSPMLVTASGRFSVPVDADGVWHERALLVVVSNASLCIQQTHERLGSVVSSGVFW